MMNWWRRKEPLRGGPAVRRMKTYSAGSGYVYQYFYRGWRAVREGTEYVFEASSDRKGTLEVKVVLLAEAVTAWERGHGRQLSGPERYAVAKIALFQAFDEREEPASLAAPVVVRASDAEAILEKLGRD